MSLAERLRFMADTTTNEFPETKETLLEAATLLESLAGKDLVQPRIADGGQCNEQSAQSLSDESERIKGDLEDRSRG